MTITPTNSPSFDKYVFKSGETIPDHLKLEGAIAITRDTKHTTFLHKLFYIAQKIHNFFLRRNDDAHMAHGVVILGKDERKPNHMVVAHSTLKGVITGSRDYLSDPTATELILYIPKDENLRKLIARYGHQTSFTKEAFRKPELGDKDIQKNDFSVSDMIGAFFATRRKTPSKTTMKRTALAVADLIQGNQLLNRKGEPRKLICIAYTLLVTQASILINTFSESEKEEMKRLARADIEKRVYDRIKKPNGNDSLSQAYWNHQVCHLNARYALSSHTNTVLTSESESVKS